MSDLLVGAALGAGLSRGGGGKQTQQATLTNTLGLNVPVTATLGTNIGGGLSQTATPSINAPQTTTANPSLSASDSDGGGLPSYVPRSAALPQYGQGPGFTPVVPGGGQDDLFLLLMVGAAAFLLLRE